MGFNKLLDAVDRRAYSDYLEHKVGNISGLDLRFKGYATINQVLNVKRDQVNGKRGDIIYSPVVQHSRPYFGYDAGFDPTILNAIRNKNVDVSGLLIPNKGLSSQTDLNRTFKPLTPLGIIR